MADQGARWFTGQGVCSLVIGWLSLTATVPPPFPLPDGKRAYGEESIYIM